MSKKITQSKNLRALLAITSATVWISVSEFVRNQLIFKTFWTEHYAGLGLVFPEKPLNGALWGVWSLGFAVLLYVLGKRFSDKETVAISWLAGFVLMWLVIGNLGVLPTKLLLAAIPLSILEVVVATFILKRFQKSH